MARNIQFLNCFLTVDRVCESFLRIHQIKDGKARGPTAGLPCRHLPGESLQDGQQALPRGDEAGAECLPGHQQAKVRLLGSSQQWFLARFFNCIDDTVINPLAAELSRLLQDPELELLFIGSINPSSKGKKVGQGNVQQDIRFILRQRG